MSLHLTNIYKQILIYARHWAFTEHIHNTLTHTTHKTFTKPTPKTQHSQNIHTQHTLTQHMQNSHTTHTTFTQHTRYTQHKKTHSHTTFLPTTKPTPTHSHNIHAHTTHISKSPCWNILMWKTTGQRRELIQPNKQVKVHYSDIVNESFETSRGDFWIEPFQDSTICLPVSPKDPLEIWKGIEDHENHLQLKPTCVAKSQRSALVT